MSRRRLAIAAASLTLLPGAAAACSSGAASSAGGGGKVSLGYGVWDTNQVPAMKKIMPVAQVTQELASQMNAAPAKEAS